MLAASTWFNTVIGRGQKAIGDVQALRADALRDTHTEREAIHTSSIRHTTMWCAYTAAGTCLRERCQIRTHLCRMLCLECTKYSM